MTLQPSEPSRTKGCHALWPYVKSRLKHAEIRWMDEFGHGSRRLCADSTLQEKKWPYQSSSIAQVGVHFQGAVSRETAIKNIQTGECIERLKCWKWKFPSHWHLPGTCQCQTSGFSWSWMQALGFQVIQVSLTRLLCLDVGPYFKAGLAEFQPCSSTANSGREFTCAWRYRYLINVTRIAWLSSQSLWRLLYRSKYCDGG